MHDVILTSEDRTLRVVAEITEHPEPPRWDAEFGVMLCVHPRYVLGDPHEGLVMEALDRFAEHGQTATIEWLRTEHGTTVVLPLFLLDHSGLSVTAGQNLLAGGMADESGWDTSMVGVIFDTAARRSDWTGDPEALLRTEVSEYDLYLRGEVYDLHVEQRVMARVRTTLTWPDGHTVEDDTTTETWVQVPGSMVRCVYGDTKLGSIAADMLYETLVQHTT